MHHHSDLRRRWRAVLVAIVLTTSALSVVQAQSAAGKTAKPSASAPDGKKIFTTTCAVCHQATGEGIEEKYPPLAGSEWVADDEAKLVRIILHGLTGPVEVAGQTIDGAMPAWGPTLKDAEIAAVLTYVRSAWGNKAAPVTTAKVASIRKATASRKTPWTVGELAKAVIPIRKE